MNNILKSKSNHWQLVALKSQSNNNFPLKRLVDGYIVYGVYTCILRSLRLFH